MRITTQLSLLCLLLMALSGKAQRLRALGPTVNSVYDDMRPVISSDGKYLYFVRKNHPDNTFGKEDSEDIWYSTSRFADEWSKAERLPLLNTARYNSVIAISKDDERLLINGVFSKNGREFLRRGLSVVKRNKRGKWGLPVALNIPALATKNRGACITGAWSQDESHIILAFSEKYAKNVYDLYMTSQKQDGSWSRPLKIAALCTRASEEAPCISNDDKTMYFSSDRAEEGKFEIYETNRLDDSWQNWSEPILAKFPVNTEGYDSYLEFDEKDEYAYFSSNYQSMGGFDIFRLDLSNRPLIADFTGKLIDDRTQKPYIGAFDIKINGETWDSLRVAYDSGIFRTKLRTKTKYNISVQAKDILPIEQEFYTAYADTIGEFIVHIGPDGRLAKNDDKSNKNNQENGGADNGAAGDAGAGNGTANNGASGNSLAGNDLANNGVVGNNGASNGIVSNDLVNNGATGKGGAGNSVAGNNVAEKSVVGNDGKEKGVGGNGIAKNDEVRNGIADNAPANNGVAEKAAVGNDGKEKGVGGNSIAKNDEAGNGIANNAPANNGVAEKSVAGNDGTRKGVGSNSIAKNDEAGNGIANNAPANNGVAGKGVAGNDGKEKGVGGNSIAKNDESGNGIADNALANNGVAEKAAVGNDGKEKGVGGNGIAKNDEVRNGIADNAPANNGVAGKGVAGNDGKEKGVGGNGIAKNDEAGNGIADNAPANNGVAGKGVAGNNAVGNGVAGNNGAGNDGAGNGIAEKSGMGNDGANSGLAEGISNDKTPSANPHKATKNDKHTTTLRTDAPIYLKNDKGVLVKKNRETGKTVGLIFQHLLFLYDKATLQASARSDLNYLLKFMRENPDVKVQIEGHTSSEGSRPYNQKLSLRRASAVRDFLIKHHVKKSRMKIRGYGPDRPFAGNATKVGREKNRRVEMNVL